MCVSALQPKKSGFKETWWDEREACDLDERYVQSLLGDTSHEGISTPPYLSRSVKPRNSFLRSYKTWVKLIVSILIYSAIIYFFSASLAPYPPQPLPPPQSGLLSTNLILAKSHIEASRFYP